MRAEAMRAQGYAIVRDGNIDVRTVSPHRRAAMVNFLGGKLGVAAMSIFKSDDDIEAMWADHRAGADVVRVTIESEPELLESGPNHLSRISHLWAYLSSDEGGEGLCAGPLGPYGVVPYIAADEARLVTLGPLAREIARRFGKLVILAKFTAREDMERIEP